MNIHAADLLVKMANDFYAFTAQGLNFKEVGATPDYVIFEHEKVPNILCVVILEDIRQKVNRVMVFDKISADDLDFNMRKNEMPVAKRTFYRRHNIEYDTICDILKTVKREFNALITKISKGST